LQIVHLFNMFKEKNKGNKKNGKIDTPSRTNGNHARVFKKNKFSGARGESRTRIGLIPLDPKSSASTISATLAQKIINNLIKVKIEVKKSSMNRGN
jgi:hypothetical protein